MASSSSRPISVHDLAPELLSRIFAFASASDAETALAISHLSTQCRHVALNTPSMWTTLDSNFSLDGVNAFIVRATNGDPAQRFDVRVAPSIALGDAVVAHITAFLNVVQLYAARWRSFTVDVPTADWMDGTIASLAHLPTIAVDEVVLRVNSNGVSDKMDYFTRGPQAYTSVPEAVFSPRLLTLDAVPAFQAQLFGPRLRELSLRNMRLPTPPSNYKALKNLTIMPTGSQMLELLHLAPNLTSLSLSSPPEAGGDAASHVTLPALTHLSVVGAATIQFAIDNIEAPALASLDIEWRPTTTKVRNKSTTDEHTDLPTRSANRYPTVQVLRVATVADVPPEAWATLFTSLPVLSHLTLEAVTGQTALGVLMSARPPLLTQLELRHVDDISVQHLGELVMSRLGVSGVEPFRELHTFWCELLDGDAVRKLREVVPYVVLRSVDEDDAEDLDFAMDDMVIRGGSSDEDDDGDDDDDEMDEDDEDDLANELALLREDNAAHGTMVHMHMH